MDNEYFQSALSNFMFEMASGGAIRHLESINWPLTVVYHTADARMISIMKKLQVCQ